MSTKAQIKASAKYNKANTVSLSIRFFKESDADVIEWIGKQDNKADAIRQLIRQAIAAEKR